jgi:hypothetical protein
MQEKGYAGSLPAHPVSKIGFIARDAVGALATGLAVSLFNRASRFGTLPAFYARGGSPE